MAIYNLTNITDGDNVLDLLRGVDQLSGDVFGFMFLLSVMVILFVAQQARSDASPKVTLAMTFWAGLMLSFLMAALGFIGNEMVIAIAALFLGALLYVWADRE